MKIAALGLFVLAHVLPSAAFAAPYQDTAARYAHATDCAAILAIAVVKAKGQNPVNDNVVSTLDKATRAAINDAIDTGAKLGKSRDQAVEDMSGKVEYIWEKSSEDDRRKCLDDYVS